MDDNKCPICGEPAEITCRCFRRDSACKNDHHWFYCVPCNKPVIGKSSHGIPIDKCACKKDPDLEEVIVRIERTFTRKEVQEWMQTTKEMGCTINITEAGMCDVIHDAIWNMIDDDSLYDYLKSMSQIGEINDLFNPSEPNSTTQESKEI